MVLETRPRVVTGIFDHRRAEGIGLDVPQDDEQVLVILDHRALESTLPDVPGTLMSLVIAPCVGHGQGLENPADRLAGHELKQKMKVVGHQAIAKQLERIATLSLPQRVKERQVIALFREDISTIIAAIETGGRRALHR